MTTHLAGNTVRLGDRAIQRCLICGYKLCDNLGTMVPVRPDGSAPPFVTFGIGVWVEVTEGSPIALRVVGETDSPSFDDHQIPNGCCIDLVE